MKDDKEAKAVRTSSAADAYGLTEEQRASLAKLQQWASGPEGAAWAEADALGVAPRGGLSDDEYEQVRADMRLLLAGPPSDAEHERHCEIAGCEHPAVHAEIGIQGWCDRCRAVAYSGYTREQVDAKYGPSRAAGRPH